MALLPTITTNWCGRYAYKVVEDFLITLIGMVYLIYRIHVIK